MSEEGSNRKQSKHEKKALINTISQAINPVMKDLQSDESCLQMPELALRCAQFFHSISQYCVSYYHSHIKQQDSKKRKMIKKQEKQKGFKGGKKDKNKEAENQLMKGNQAKKLQPPKKPLTAYIIYFQDKKPLFVERYRTLGLSELTKLIAKQWKELSQSEKQLYLDRASEDRKRYEEQMNQFKSEYSKIYGKVNGDFEAKDSNLQDQEIEAIINAEKGILPPEQMAVEIPAQKQEIQIDAQPQNQEEEQEAEQDGQEANQAEQVDEQGDSESQFPQANNVKNDSEEQSEGEEQEEASGQAAGSGENGEVQQ